MAVTAITSEVPALNVRSSDFPFIAGGGSGNAIVATSTTDGWEVSPASGTQFDERTVVIFGSDGTGGTVTFKAGDRYPAQRADLGDLGITLAANDGRVVFPEMSRFLKNDGTFIVVPSTTGLVITVVQTVKAP
jgi:hypothetical protein